MSKPVFILIAKLVAQCISSSIQYLSLEVYWKAAVLRGGCVRKIKHC